MTRNLTEDKWKTDPETGDLILEVDGVCRARIPKPNEIRFDSGKKGGPTTSLDDIKKEIERVLNV